VDDENRLFSGDEHVDNVRDIYGSWQWDIREELDKWTPEQVLAAEPEDIADRLLAECSIACPVLHREQAVLLPPSEDGELTKLVLAVPFDGYAGIFAVRADGDLDWHEMPRAQVAGGELRLTWAGRTDANPDPAAVLHEFNLRLDEIERQLSILRPGIEEEMTKISEEATRIISSRRERILVDRKLEAGLGIPVRRRADAAQFTVPVTRRKIRPEPFLPEEHYEQALAALRNARNALERSPSMTSHLDEERIRDLLLFFLNGQFEGAAVGEVFNAHGKTDILIRAKDRNVFIAECKIFAQKNKQRVEKVVGCALDQLLSYLAWRDTKAALLLFIRSGQPTSIISKAIAEIERHPNFVRTLSAGEDGERYDCMLRANDDPSQEIRLAFLPFALLDYSDEA
jgi:hypothetical protein